MLGKDFDTHQRELRPQMNVVSASTSLSSTLTVRQNLKIFGLLYAVKNLDRRIDELLERFEIAHLAKVRSRHLSTGQNARLLLCKGLLNNPKILLLDECTIGLDPDIAVKTRQIILDIQREFATTMLFTSHNMAEVELLCNRMAFLNNGEILKIGRTQDIRRLINMQKVEIHFSGSKKRIRDFLKAQGITPDFPAEGVVVFEIKDVKDELPKVVEPFFKLVRVHDLNIDKPRLEDVFIKVARGEL